MQEVVMDFGRITLTLPDGFDEMTDEELAALGGRRNGNNWVYRNLELGLIYNFAWNKLPFFSRKTDVAKMVETTENSFSKAVPSFKKERDINVNISGYNGVGFIYSYEINGGTNMSQYLLFKTKDQVIAFICTGPADSFEDNYNLYEELLDTVRIV